MRRDIEQRRNTERKSYYKFKYVYNKFIIVIDAHIIYDLELRRWVSGDNKRQIWKILKYLNIKLLILKNL